MAFKSFPVALGTSDTDVFECPATSEAAAVLMVSNVSASARTYTLKFYKQATGLTKTLLSGVSIAANSAAKVPAPLTLEEGDKIIMSASAASDVVVSGTITVSTAAPVATGFTPRGAWSSEATYARNDIAEKNGTSYISLQDANTDNNPETETAFWMVLADRGPPGEMSGPAGSTAGNIASYDDSTGKVLADSGIAASDVLVTSSIGNTVQGYDAATLKGDVENQSVTGGANITPKDLGTISSGTVTIDVGDRPMQTYQNDGAHTLESTGAGSTVLRIVNGASAGAITLTAFGGRVYGDSFDTTEGSVFRCVIEDWSGTEPELFVQKLV